MSAYYVDDHFGAVFLQGRWLEALHPRDIQTLAGVAFTALFYFISRILHVQILRRHLRLNQCCRGIVAILFLPVTIPLVIISFLVSFFGDAGIAFIGGCAAIGGCIAAKSLKDCPHDNPRFAIIKLICFIGVMLITASLLFSFFWSAGIACICGFAMISCYIAFQFLENCPHIDHPRPVVVRLICSVGIILIAPVVFLCWIASRLIEHVKQFGRFHQYVGSNRTSIVLLDDHSNVFLKLSNFLVDRMYPKLLGE